MTLTNITLRNLLTLALLLVASSALAELRVGSVCRVKGQEENTLQGLGLVVGLKGTGDADISPTIRALARTMQHMGAPVSNGKLAMWVFLVTEIMFFTGLIGTYMVLRNGMPTKAESCFRDASSAATAFWRARSALSYSMSSSVASA